MTDLDNTQIINDDESLLQNSSTLDTEASLKIISGADSNTYQIGKETIIGRSNPSDLVISAPSLSKQHAKITINNGQYFITDLGSSNKTFHNKIQLQPNVCYALHSGDEIKLGDIICLFEEQKSTETNKNTFSEPTYQTYIPAVNTLVEEDSPWFSDDDIPPPVITETNADVIPSTQTITDSYDDEEPTQPMKIWNGNNNTNRLSRTSIKNSDDVTPKQNGLTSSFIPPSSTSNNDHDDNSLVIGGTTLPATIPLVIESTQINDDDQLEIVSSSQTKKVIEEDNNTITIETTTTTTTTAIEIDNTQAYTLEPPSEIISSDNQITETQPYELESEQTVTDVTETKREELHQVVIDGNTMIEQTTTTTTTTTTTLVTDSNNPIVQTLAYDLQPTDEETTTTTTILVANNNNPIVQTLAYDLQSTDEEITTATTTTTATVIENDNAPIDTLAYDLQPTNEQINTDDTKPAVCPDTQQYDLDEQIDDLSPRPASETLEVVPVSKLVEQLEDAENVPDDTPSRQQVEVIINQDIVKEAATDEQMDTNETDLPLATVNDEPATKVVAEQQENINKTEDEVVPTGNTDAMAVDETDKGNAEVQPTAMEDETASDLNKSLTTSSIESEQKIDEPTATSIPEEVLPSTLDIGETQEEEAEGEGEGGAEEEEEETQESAPVSGRGQRGVPRRAARRARGRRGGGASRARVVSTRIHGGRRNAVLPSTVDNGDNNATLEETVNTETEESPKKPTPIVEQKSISSTPVTPVDETSPPSQTNSSSNIRVSARIKARASNGRNRQFPYTDDYVDLDDLEKQSKTPNTSSPSTTTTTTTAGRRSARGGRSSSTPQKRISLRQQPIDASESPDEKNKNQNDNTDIYEQMDTGGENEEPVLSTKTVGRKRKSITPVASATTKRSRPTTPQTAPVINTRRKQSSITEQSSPSNTNTPKRGRKPTKLATPTEQASPEKQILTNDRPVRIALSSHLNFDQNYLDALRKLGFEIMDESCQVDALVVDRIRRTKKFFMCLARGAHILSPTWIEAMIKENRYIPYDKYYLEDTNAEQRYGFQLRESVRLAKQHPIFENYKIFCTKDTSPPYDDLKDIIEAAGGKFIEKINMNKPGKDLICIVGQIHKTEYEDLYKKGVPVVSEEFALSGISKQKLDFDAFSLFQNAPTTTVKTTGNK